MTELLNSFEEEQFGNRSLEKPAQEGQTLCQIAKQLPFARNKPLTPNIRACLEFWKAIGRT